MMRFYRLLSLFTAIFLSLTHTTSAGQEVQNDIIFIEPYGIHQLEMPTDTITLYQNDSHYDFEEFCAYSISNTRNYLLHWDYYNVLDDTLAFVDFQSGKAAELELARPSDMQIEFEEAQWIFGDLYAIISAGVYEIDSYMAHPLPSVSVAWLFDRRTHAISPWFWECKSVVLLNKAQRFGLYCPPNPQIDAAQTMDAIILSENGIQATDEAYTILNSQPYYSAKPSWEFSSDHEAIVYTDCVELSCTFFRYTLATQQSERLFRKSELNFFRFYWSPTNEYLFIISDSVFSLYSFAAGRIIAKIDCDMVGDLRVTYWFFAFRSDGAGFYLFLATHNPSLDNSTASQYLRRYSIMDGKVSLKDERGIPDKYDVLVTEVSTK